MNPIILTILSKRGFKTQKEIEQFFDPSWEDFFYDPFRLKNMKKAVGRIRRAIEDKQKIAVYGDFDGDGIPGAAMVYLALKKLGANDPMVYISKTHDLSTEFIQEIAEKDYKVIITVDLGSSSFDGCAVASELGIDLIIVDHHNTQRKNPDCYSFINPKQKGDRYPWKYLLSVWG